MPISDIKIYRAKSGHAPLLEWLDKLPGKARIKCLVKIELLSEQGHELRRPHCDYLKNGIYELRIRYKTAQLRILYAFHDKNAVLLTHGITKEKVVPEEEIRRAITYLKEFMENPQKHTCRERR